MKQLAWGLGLIALGLGTPVLAADKIPSQFHGFWEQPEKCAMALEFGGPDTGAIIDGDSVAGYEEHCSVAKVRHVSANQIEVDLVCSEPEGEYKRTSTFRLYDNKFLVSAYEHAPSWPMIRCE